MPKNRARMRATVSTVAAVALAALTGCTPSAPSPDDDRPLVLTTFTVIADMAREVAGDRVRVESITRVGAEIHGYEPTPGDLRRAGDADLILDNGLGLEAWFEQFIAAVDAPRVTLTDGIEPVFIAGTDAINPHAWMSPFAAEQYLENIVVALSDLDPAGAAEFEGNAGRYLGALAEVANELSEAMQSVPLEQRVLVTCEGAFSYLARDLEMDEVYIWPVNAEQQATPQRIAAAIELVRAREVPAVFCETTVSADPMMQVVDSTGAAFGGSLYVDSLSEPDGPVPTYLDLLRYNVDLIVEGLTS